MPRGLEFAEEAELAKRMGVPRHLWLRAALKEMLDNALDACEEAGVAPEIRIGATARSLTVGDNGPGIAPEVVAALADRSLRTSSRAAYAEPSRGAQGNALQVLMCLALGMGQDEAVTAIRSHGIEHRIVITVHRLRGELVVDHHRQPCDRTTGTEVVLEWRDGVEPVALQALVAEFSILNPHADFEVDGGRYPAHGAITKWQPGTPISAHWYSPAMFEARVLAELWRDPSITVAQFVGTFAGMTSGPKRGRVAADAGLSYARLDALLDDSGTALDVGRTHRLLRAMRVESRPPNPRVLGAVGKEMLLSAPVLNQGSGRSDSSLDLTYRTFDGVDKAGIPFRYELLFAPVPGAQQRVLLLGNNFSPAIDAERMLRGLVSPAGGSLYYLGQREPVVLLVHRISPARASLDYGKGTVDVGHAESTQLHDALAKITRAWRKSRASQDTTGRPPLPKKKRITLIDAACEVMEQAYLLASDGGRMPVLAQQVYYAARPLMLEIMGVDDLGENARARFCYGLLPQYMQDNVEPCATWRVLYKPRGTLVEPHTEIRIGLGTKEVNSYRTWWTNGLTDSLEVEISPWRAETCGPAHRYGAVLVVEKGGVGDLLLEVGLHTRRDIAIVSNEGHSPEAELRLVDAVGVPVFVLTDLDRQGFSIASNLLTGTWRHEYRTAVDVCRIGLTLEQVEALGGVASDGGALQDEPIGESTRKHVSDERLIECGATADEIVFLHDRRVELNALSTTQLVDLVESALDDAGVRKVVPDKDVITTAWRAANAREYVREVAARVAEEAAAKWAEADPPPDLTARIRAALEANPSRSWDEALMREVAI